VPTPRFEFPSERDPQQEPQHRLCLLVDLREKALVENLSNCLRTRRPEIAIGNLQDFGYSSGVAAWSRSPRVLSYAEVLVIATTNKLEPFHGVVLQDFDLNRNPRQTMHHRAHLIETVLETASL
jgi:hypothetical protein